MRTHSMSMYIEFASNRARPTTLLSIITAFSFTKTSLIWSNVSSALKYLLTTRYLCRFLNLNFRKTSFLATETTSSVAGHTVKRGNRIVNILSRILVSCCRIFCCCAAYNKLTRWNIFSISIWTSDALPNSSLSARRSLRQRLVESYSLSRWQSTAVKRTTLSLPNNNRGRIIAFLSVRCFEAWAVVLPSLEHYVSFHIAYWRFSSLMFVSWK